MICNRREMLAACAGAVPLLINPDATGKEAAALAPMGVIIHSYSFHLAGDKDGRFRDPLAFLDFCRQRGGGGVQVSLGVRDETYAARIRKQLEEHRLYLEGSIRLPRDRADLERFTAEVQTARRCGAAVLRTAALSGRRYETFASAKAFEEFARQARRSLALAKPVVERHKARLALENHKDWQVSELLELLKEVRSPFIGVCLDTGNNMSLLENPLEVVLALAPYAFTTHLKDMGVEEYVDGFLLAEVPLGTGILDLPRIIAALRQAQPRIHLNLEMITRDPLQIQCLTRKYWATLGNVPGQRLADMLALVRAHAPQKPLPRVSGLSREKQLRREDDNVRQSLRYARERLKG